MRIPLKKLKDQVVVITGATSGIGLVTARKAADAGAKLVIVARNEEALQELSNELAGLGAEVIYVAADVGSEEQVRAIAQAAIMRFGGFDTWVNNAGVSIFGRIEEVSTADQKRLFDTNFWGVVHGSVVAVEQLRQRGGALINIGSEVSDVAIPLQGIYSASKHAVKGFTDALRLELEHARAPVSVTLIKPAAIDTLYVKHAKNYLDREPRLPPPIYSPDLVADAILFAASHPRRDIYVGGAARIFSASSKVAPRTTDWLLKRTMFHMQRSNKLARDAADNALYAPSAELREREGMRGVRQHSLATQAELHPKVAILIGLAVIAAAGVLLAPRVRRRIR